MLELEKKKPLSERNCIGDASETGLIKFYQGIYDLEAERAKYPPFCYKAGDKNIECRIPFSSEIKFNLFIRDMNTAVKNPQRPEDCLTVVMKGAPERILARCSKILINGEEREFD